MTRNIIGNEVPAKAVAQVCFMTGTAIIETPDGKVWSYEADKPPGEALVEQRIGFHPGMFLQPALASQMGSPIELAEAGEYPFVALITEIGQKYRAHRAITAFLSALDPDMERSIRESFASAAGELLKEGAVRGIVEPILVGQPVPHGFDTQGVRLPGAAGEILEKIRQAWG
jgi:hypothetical protein